MIKSQDPSSRMSTDRLAPILRQFTRLSQLSAFLKNGNLIKAKQRGDQQYCLEVLLPCQGGIAWVPILIWLTTTGLTIATNRWIIRPYLIQPFKDKIQKSSMSENAKKVACLGVEVADFVLMTLLGGALDAGVKFGMAKLASKQAADIAIKVFEKKFTEKVVEHAAKEGATAGLGTAVSQGLGFFKELAMGAKDFLRLEDTFIEAAVRHGMEESVLKQALASFYYHLGGAVPRMAISVASIHIPLVLAKQPEKEGTEAWARQIYDLEGSQVVRIYEQVPSEPRTEPQKQPNDEKVRRNEKIKVGKRLYLAHIRKGLEVTDELIIQIQNATNLPNKSVEKLIEKLKDKYPTGSEDNSDTSSQLSGLTNLTLASTDSSTPSSSLCGALDDDRNLDESTDFMENNSLPLPTLQSVENTQKHTELETDLNSNKPLSPVIGSEGLSTSKFITTYKI